MKKVLMYGAIGGIALYLYLQLQKKKKAVPSQTADVKQDTSESAIPSGTGGIKPPKPVPTKPTTPPMTLTTPKGEGDGVSVKDDVPTPPAPTVEPVFVTPPKPVYGGIKPPKPVVTKPLPTKPVITKPPVITTKPIKPPVITTKPIKPPVITTKPIKPPVITTKPIKPIFIKDPIIPKYGDPTDKISEDELGRTVDIKTGRPIGMPIPQPILNKNLDVLDFTIPRPKISITQKEVEEAKKSSYCQNVESQFGKGAKIQFGRGTVIVNGQNTRTSVGISPSISRVNRDCIEGYMDKFAK